MSQALESLNKKDIGEIKSYGRPPAQVEMVMQAVMILRGNEPTWAEAKRQLGELDTGRRARLTHFLIGAGGGGWARRKEETERLVKILRLRFFSCKEQKTTTLHLSKKKKKGKERCGKWPRCKGGKPSGPQKDASRNV